MFDIFLQCLKTRQSTQLSEPPTKVSGLHYKGKEAKSLFVSPILKVTVNSIFKSIDIVAT